MTGLNLKVTVKGTGSVLPLGTVFSKPSPYGVVEVRNIRDRAWQLTIDGQNQMKCKRGYREPGVDKLLAATVPTKVFMAGLGAGVMAREVLDDPRVMALDIYEINPVVIEAQKHFPFSIDDPRVTITVGDARRALEGFDAQYDALVINIENRGRSHVDWFYTDEARLAYKRALRDGGAYTLWDMGRIDKVTMESKRG